LDIFPNDPETMALKASMHHAEGNLREAPITLVFYDPKKFLRVCHPPHVAIREKNAILWIQGQMAERGAFVVSYQISILPRLTIFRASQLFVCVCDVKNVCCMVTCRQNLSQRHRTNRVICMIWLVRVFYNILCRGV
jgi:hypothetical protein